jgi:hypothetical protein
LRELLGLDARSPVTVDGRTGKYFGGFGSGTGSTSFMPESGKGPAHGNFEMTFKAPPVP